MTSRLIGTAMDNWAEYDGWAVANNIPDLTDLHLSQFENLTWWWLIRNAPDEQEIEKLRIDLWRPPKGVEATSGPWSAAAESRALASFKQQLSNRG